MNEKDLKNTNISEDEFLNSDNISVSDGGSIDESEFDDMNMDDDDELREFIGDMDAKDSPGMKLVLFVVVLAVGVYVLYILYPDVMYFFANKKPVALGFVDRLKENKIPPSNTYVSVIGVRHIERLELHSLFKDRVLFPFIGSNKVFVITDSKFDDERLAKEGMSERTYKGRLLRIGDLSYYEKVYDWFWQNRRKKISPNTVVIEEGVQPSDMKWILIAYIGVVLAMLWTLWRIKKMFSKDKKRF